MRVVGGAGESLGVGRVDEADLDALVLHRVGEQVPGAAVQVGRGDDVVAGPGQVLHRERRGRLAGRHRERRDAAFQRGEALLQRILRRVHDAGVDVAEFLQREQVGRVLGAVELVGRGLIDRHRDGIGGAVAAPAGMQRERFRVFAGCHGICLLAGLGAL